MVPKSASVGNADHTRMLARRAKQTIEEASGKLGDKSAAGAIARGKVYELVGYFSEAAECYSEALGLDAHSDEARVRLAIARLKGGDAAGGLEAIVPLAKSNPKFRFQALATDEVSGPLTILGDALLANGRRREAAEALESACKINKDDTYAAGRLAQILLTSGLPERAERLSSTFKANPRFDGLGAALASEQGRIEGRFQVAGQGIYGTSILSFHGRPYLVEGEERLAGLVPDEEGWCV